MRTFTAFASGDTKELLATLAKKDSSHESYGTAMTALGRNLAVSIAEKISELKESSFCIACTVEDADFLAKGLLDGLEDKGVDGTHLKLVCFWNERIRKFDDSDEDSFDVAPIIKEYREEVDISNAVLIVVKSIISGACVVKTNLATLIDREIPQKIFVAAPVMYKGAEERLMSEFPEKTSEMFEYVTFAIDDEKGADENVVPGIGGSVYERLGFVDKNAYVPEIVKLRRQRTSHA